MFRNATCRFSPKQFQSFRRYSSDQLPAVGTTIHGWKVVNRREVTELDLQAVQLQNVRFPNAEYLHLRSDDENNAFSINFKTIPMDSTGIAHILEHTTLCGSAKFPVRQFLRIFESVPKSPKS